MKNGRFYLDYMRHWFMANTRHGTHSPFVYRLVDEVIYAPAGPAEPRNKVERLVSRLLVHFSLPQPYRPGLDPVPDRVDFVVVDPRHVQPDGALLDMLRPRLHRGSVVAVVGIYRTGEMKKLWQTIKALPEVTVTVDLFRVGLVFFHEGQAREDFMIRL